LLRPPRALVVFLLLLGSPAAAADAVREAQSVRAVPATRVTRQRGRIFASEWGALLRIPGAPERRRAFEAFVRDLRSIRKAVQNPAIQEGAGR
jgi:hypothetical protein